MMFVRLSRQMRIKMLLLTLLLVQAAWGLSSASAQASAAALHVPATLEAENSGDPESATARLAFHFKPETGWHGYWQNPGDAGFGMTLDWDLPAGVEVEAVHYPVPEPLLIKGLMNHVYEKDYAVLVDLSIANGVRRGSKLPIKVKASWLACSDRLCVPQAGSFSTVLQSADGSATPAPAPEPRFDTWRAAIPSPLNVAARYKITGKKIAIAVPIPASAKVDRPYFFAKTLKLFRYAAPQNARRSGDWLIIEGEVTKDYPGSISGLLRLGEDFGVLLDAKPGEIPPGGEAIAAAGQSGVPTPTNSVAGFAAIFGLSLLGGLLLNLMPCVFPILGLKALTLAKMGGNQRAARRDAIYYTCGVIIGCLALGGLLLALRAGGEQVGWAFQLQEPRFVLLLLLLMLAVTLNLAGLFELQVPQTGSSPDGAFGTGLLAAVVATPCTGPFMAAAMGAALLLPTVQALLLFAALGTGLALPYLLLAFMPSLQRLLPKPGPWLDSFRRWMALPMGLTALALLWLLWRLSGSQLLIVAILLALALASALWLIGRQQRRGVGVASVAISAFALFGLLLAVVPKTWFEPQPKPTVTERSAEPYSREVLARYRAAGKPVFLYLTADWCVTCKVNEAAAIDRAETQAAFERAGVKVMVGDYTRRDAALTELLTSHGRSGVPLYLFYPDGGGQARVLPQLLTTDMLLQLTNKGGPRG